MNSKQLREKFKQQINQSIDQYSEEDPKCAYAAGMLHIVTALKSKDGPTLSMQLMILHQALVDVGLERGWAVEKLGR